MFVSIYEKSAEAALQRLVRLPAAVDGAELRVDGFSQAGELIDFDAFRNATDKLLIYTRRSTSFRDRATLDELSAAAGAGFDLVDAEVEQEYGVLAFPGSTSDFMGRWHERTLLSLHDYAGVPADLEAVVQALEPFAPFKVAVTPKSFEEDLRLLRALVDYRSRAAGYEKPPQPGSDAAFATRGTIFGMGARGLYSRLLAPFFGSELTFVAADAATQAGPAQITVDDALSIYGDDRRFDSPPRALFAVVGNPAAHSRSPLIHNPLFRERRLSAAYSIIDCERLGEVTDRFFVDDPDPLMPVGLSITAPFKEEAFAECAARGVRMSAIAARAKAVNLIVRIGSIVVAENTDVSGFMQLLGGVAGVENRVLVLGAGGTARAALVALEQLGLRAVVTNRSEVRGQQLAEEFGVPFVAAEEARHFAADLVIDTLPGTADFDSAAVLRQARTAIVADYSSAARAAAAQEAGVGVIDGLRLLQAQAIGQTSLFLQAIARGEA
jgi:shikimate 5-dehydrogenase/3-dehydroquinate dehydratase